MRILRHFLSPVVLVGATISVSTFVFAEAPAGNLARVPAHVKGGSKKGPTGLAPSQVRKFYGFDSITNQGFGQIIALIEAFDHPDIEADLNTFNVSFGLPRCTTKNGCFRKIYAAGVQPRTDADWALEIALDVEWAHAIAPEATILLVEADSNSFPDLMLAVDVAVANGATAISMSFGSAESSSLVLNDSHFANKPNATFFAPSGDKGTGVQYPASSPYVVSVGGTSAITDSVGAYLGETAWPGSGGGISTLENSLAGAADRRAVPDVAYSADPNSGFSVYNSVKYQGQAGWFQVGGTSAGPPQWAALFAIANSIRAATAGKQPLNGPNTITSLQALYTILSTSYHDIVFGSNGNCAICNAAAGYDYVTGLGSPQAANLIANLVKLP